MPSVQTPIVSVNPRAAALVAIEQMMAARGAAAIRPEDLVEVVARLASAMADPPAVAGAVPWEVFEPELLAQYGSRLRSLGTLRAVKHAIRVLRDEMNVATTADLNVQLISRIVTTRDAALSPNTVRGLLRTVSAIAGHAVAFGYLPASPFAKRPIRSWVRASKPRNTRHLTKVELRKILDTLALDVREKRGWAQYRARRLEALVTLIAFTGLRRNEALYLMVEDIDLENGILRLVDRKEHRLKTEKSAQDLPIVPPLAKCLREWLSHRDDAPEGFDRKVGPWLFPNIRCASPWVNGPTGYKPLDRLKIVAARAGVADASFQQIRRAVATHLEAAGAGEAMIMRILRHSNVQTGRTYYRKNDVDNVRDAMKDFDY